MNKKTVALTLDQYREIIQTMREGFTGAKPNPRIAAEIGRASCRERVFRAV